MLEAGVSLGMLESEHLRTARGKNALTWDGQSSCAFVQSLERLTRGFLVNLGWRPWRSGSSGRGSDVERGSEHEVAILDLERLDRKEGVKRLAEDCRSLPERAGICKKPKAGIRIGKGVGRGE